MKWSLADNTVTTGSFGQISVSGTAATGAPVDVVLNDSGSMVDFTNSFWSTAQTWPVLTAASRTGSFTLGSGTATDVAGRPSTGYGNFTIQQTGTAVNLVWSPLTADRAVALHLF